MIVIHFIVLDLSVLIYVFFFWVEFLHMKNLRCVSIDVLSFCIPKEETVALGIVCLSVKDNGKFVKIA